MGHISKIKTNIYKITGDHGIHFVKKIISMNGFATVICFLAMETI